GRTNEAAKTFETRRNGLSGRKREAEGSASLCSLPSIVFSIALGRSDPKSVRGFRRKHGGVGAAKKKPFYSAISAFSAVRISYCSHTKASNLRRVLKPNRR